MNRFASTVVLIIFNSVIIAMAAERMKITPIAVENKSNLKGSDLKVEEARYRDPVMPEYYGSSYDRNRQNFVTGSNYGSYAGGMSSYDRYGSGMGYDKYGSGIADRYGSGNGDRYGSSGYDRYGSQWNQDKIGPNYQINPDKVNYMPGGTYNPANGVGGYGSPLGINNRNPYEGGSINGPYPGPGGVFPGSGAGLFTGGYGDSDGKSVLLPLAGAALLGIAAYALVSNPAVAMGTMGPGSLGKRRKRSLFDEKIEQHLMYRAHQKANKKK